MSNAEQLTKQTEELPAKLESPRAKLVYLYLQTTGSSLEDLQSALDIPKITLYSVLRTLRERSLVEKQGQQFVVVE